MGTFDAKKWHDEATNARQPKVDTVQERIIHHGSWNLAVALLAPNFDWIRNIALDNEKNERETLEQELEIWQKYFHNKLKNGKI